MTTKKKPEECSVCGYLTEKLEYFQGNEDWLCRYCRHSICSNFSDNNDIACTLAGMLHELELALKGVPYGKEKS